MVIVKVMVHFRAQELCPPNVHDHVDKHVNNLARPRHHWLGEERLKNRQGGAEWCAP